jgi:hypothetical protein
MNVDKNVTARYFAAISPAIKIIYNPPMNAISFVMNVVNGKG